LTTHGDYSNVHLASATPGAEPGIDTTIEDDELLPEHLSNLKAACTINIIDYSEERRVVNTATNKDLVEKLEEPRAPDLPCRWISVNGISWDVIRIIGNKYRLHQLAIEDLIHPRSRTKVDWYSDHAAIVLTLQKLVRLHSHTRHDSDDCSECPSTPDDSDLISKHEGVQRAKHTWLSRAFGRKDHVLPTVSPNKLEGTVSAHSSPSQESPVTEIRTLHRYENAAIPEHTAWMEKHSPLTAEDLAVSVEQVCLFLLNDNTVVSFFEQSGEEIERPIMARLNSKYTVLRRSCDASMLLQAVIDAIVDLAGPVREAYNTARKELQIAAMTHPDIRTSRALHIFGEEIDMLQNLFKPIVHLVNALRDHNADPSYRAQQAQPGAAGLQVQTHMTPVPTQRHEGTGLRPGAMTNLRRTSYMRRDESLSSVAITPLAHTYFGDVLDHCITTIAALEQMDASANNISNLIFNTVSAKTNNFMMILAVVTVFFAPLTFISGYFGMNFANGAGLDHPFAFFFVVATPSVIGFMLLVLAIYKTDAILEWLARGRWRPQMRSLGLVRRRAIP
jgi:Mg2+ and Co2+ transporter CorA